MKQFLYYTRLTVSFCGSFDRTCAEFQFFSVTVIEIYCIAFTALICRNKRKIETRWRNPVVFTVLHIWDTLYIRLRSQQKRRHLRGERSAFQLEIKIRIFSTD